MVEATVHEDHDPKVANDEVGSTVKVSDVLVYPFVTDELIKDIHHTTLRTGACASYA